MLKKTFAVAVLAIGTFSPLLMTGCKSASSQPNAVTGYVAPLPDNQNPRYLDQKGHFRPEWIEATGH